MRRKCVESICGLFFFFLYFFIFIVDLVFVVVLNGERKREAEEGKETKRVGRE